MCVCVQEMHKYELPLREQGFHSVVELVSAMPHIVRVERPYENGDWLLSDATQAPCTAGECVGIYSYFCFCSKYFGWFE